MLWRPTDTIANRVCAVTPNSGVDALARFVMPNLYGICVKIVAVRQKPEFARFTSIAHEQLAEAL